MRLIQASSAEPRSVKRKALVKGADGGGEKRRRRWDERMGSPAPGGVSDGWLLFWELGQLLGGQQHASKVSSLLVPKYLRLAVRARSHPLAAFW